MLECMRMKATIVDCPFGIFAFDNERQIIEKFLFPKNPQNAAKTIAKIKLAEILDEIQDLIKLLQKKGYDTFIFENASLGKEIQAKLAVNVELEKTSNAGEFVRSHIEQFAVETGFAKDTEEFKLWMHNLTLEMAKDRIKDAVEKRDLIVAQAIQTLDDLDKVINMLMSRIREWYGVHFPELDRLLEKHETYARLIVNLSSRNNFTVENLEEEGIPKTKAEAITKTAEKSMGADLVQTDLAEIQTLCQNVLNLYQQRQTLESYLDKSMNEVAPNTKALVGSLLGARLIAISGGLQNLARKPASTIQVLGAEKALFRSLKTGTRPPKHGMIFQHTLLHDAKKWQRGKIARALAGKVAIAARTDAFGRRDIGNRFKAELDRRIDEIREKYAEPPPIPAARPPQVKHRQEQKRRKHRRER